MLLKEWTPSTLIDTDKVFLQRTTLTDHGVVIHHLGSYRKPLEYSSRRYSVISVEVDGIYFIVGSTSYHSGFESTDRLEPLKKFASGEFQVLLKKRFDGPIEDALLWMGDAQTLMHMD